MGKLGRLGLVCLCSAPGIARAEWNQESELAIAVASGNSNAQTYQLKDRTAYKWQANQVIFGAHYLYGTAKSVEAAKNWDGSLRYERSLTERLSVFAAQGWEGDVFAGYDYRALADAGAKLFVIGDDKSLNSFITEAGYRFAHEHRIAGTVPVTLDSQILRLYLEGNRSLSESLSARAWIELLPDLAHGNNFQGNFEPSLSVLLSSSFSLKFAYLGKYRNTPVTPGKQRYDSLLTTALIAKF